LRSITAKKFAMGGVDLSDGSIVPPAKRPKASGVAMARPAAAIPSGVVMARPASATVVMARPAAATPAGGVLKRPADATPAGVVMAKPAAATTDLPKGWSYQLRSLKSGRRYPVWTSKTGKIFYSWKAVQRVV
jgi:cell division septation protein DedD